MAVHLAAGVADYLKRTTSLLSPASDSTVMAWVNMGVAPVGAAYQTFWIALDDPSVYTQYISLDADSFQNMELTGTGPLHVPTGSAPSTGTWSHVCWTQTGTTQRFYLNGALIGNFTLNRAAFTVGFELVGNDTFSQGNLSIASVREWQSALTLAQIQAEMASATAVLAAPFLDTPLVSDLLDDSGNGRNWTQVGSGSFVAGPTFATNETPAAAIDITALTYTETIVGVGAATQDTGYPTTCDTTGYHPLWWTYTPPSGTNLISIKPTGTTYSPQLSIFTGTPPSLTQYTIDNVGGTQLFCGVLTANFWWEVPVVAGTTYYIRFTDSGNTATDTTTFTLLVQGQPLVSAPPGSLMIPDDTIDFPAVLLSGTTGSFLQTPRFPAGERAAILPDGHIATEYNQADQVAIYDETLALLQLQAAISPAAITANETAFYVLARGVGTARSIQKILTDGTLSTTWAPTNAASNSFLVVDRAEAFAYYSRGVASDPIRTWDLVGDVAAANLTTVPVGQNLMGNGDGGTLANGTIYFAYQSASTLADNHLRGYNTAGTLQFDYTVTTGTNKLNHAAYYPGTTGTGGADPESVWLWIYLSGSTLTDRFTRIKMLDGSTVVSFDVTGAGTSGQPGVVDSPLAVSNSCPMIVTRTTLDVPSLTGAIIVIKVTVPPELLAFDYQTTGGLGPPTFSLANGETQTYTSLAPGLYGVTEEVTTNWTTTYVVDNGDEHDAITLAEGETVTVTVTNTFVSAGGSVREYLVRRERTFPVIAEELQRIFFSDLTLDLQAGNGLTTGQGSNPLLELDWSDDGGFTWSSLRFIETGRIGQYDRRAIARMLGQSRNRVFRVAVSDPVQWILCSGYMRLTIGTS